MRTAVLCVAALTFCSAALAQQTTGSVAPAPAAPSASVQAPAPGDPLFPDSSTGLDKVAKDGISTEVVKAAPCGAAAHETDGTTTCVGIPDRR